MADFSSREPRGPLLDSLKPDDALADQLVPRPAVAAPPASLGTLTPPPVGNTAAPQATVNRDRPAPEQADHPAAALDFLRPPEGPDELGWLGTYRVCKVLGSGGMGTVFLAEDTLLQRPVALKVMRPELGTDLPSRQRFLREARAAAAVKHDHVVTIYQVGQDHDVPFLAMEFLPGESLEARLRREGRRPAAEVLRLGRETAEGLAAAHARGLIHRDVKPANLWLEGPAGRVKILDFGLVRAPGAGGNLTCSGLIVGTPHYMAPEQARGHGVDARADLFSLGCVLYRMIAGRPPFGGSDLLTFLASLAVDRPRPLAELNPDVPPALADLVHRLLDKDPERRPASAQAVVEAIRAVEHDLDHSSAPKLAPRQPVAAFRTPPRRTRSFRKKRWLAAGLGVVIALAACAFLLWPAAGDAQPKPDETPAPAPVARAVPEKPPIKVGVLHSVSGTMAEGGNAVVDATALAIEEINDRGGLLGRRVEAVVRDGASDADVYTREAERLIVEDKVSVVFGCWTSSARKAVREVVERHDHLLVYPLQYEGLEQSPNVVYNGAAPNQQIIPAVRYAYGFLDRRRFFLVGSDYVFPRTAHAILRDELKALGAEVVGEEYLPLGSADVAGVVRKIAAAKPDMILNTINGDGNRPFFRALRAAGLTPDRVPTLSFSVGENELRSLAARDVVGDYAAWNYFQSLDRPENAAFVQRFRAKYGPQRVISDPMESAYVGVHLWAKAVEAAGSDDVRAVRRAFRGQGYDGPGGTVRVDAENQHTWKAVRLGRIVEGGQFEVLWSSEKPVRPEPYPPSRARAEWDHFLNDLYRGWGGRWSGPDR